MTRSVQLERSLYVEKKAASELRASFDLTFDLPQLPDLIDPDRTGTLNGILRVCRPVCDAKVSAATVNAVAVINDVNRRHPFALLAHQNLVALINVDTRSAMGFVVLAEVACVSNRLSLLSRSWRSLPLTLIDETVAVCSLLRMICQRLSQLS